MPPKKLVEHRSRAAENDLLLQYGPRNNIISWRDRMEEESVELYGMTGTCFSTDRAYQIPYPLEKDFHPFPEMLINNTDSDDDDEYTSTVPTHWPLPRRAKPYQSLTHQSRYLLLWHRKSIRQPRRQSRKCVRAPTRQGRKK